MIKITVCVKYVCINAASMYQNIIVLIGLLLFQLDIIEPKTPDDIYKTHLDNARKFHVYYLYFNVCVYIL